MEEETESTDQVIDQVILDALKEAVSDTFFTEHKPPCSYCRKKYGIEYPFFDRKDLIDHMRKVHPDIKFKIKKR